MEGVVRVHESCHGYHRRCIQDVREHRVSCTLSNAFIFFRLGLAAYYASLFDGAAGSWGNSLDTGDEEIYFYKLKT